ncbi:MAG TPA: hypothetical protein VGA72_12915 [Anaerolineales bacterium]
MSDPIIVPDIQRRADGQPPIAATGQSFEIHEWSGSGPDYIHVQHDDEAWHIREGTLTFRFIDKQMVFNSTAGKFSSTSARRNARDFRWFGPGG